MTSWFSHPAPAAAEAVPKPKSSSASILRDDNGKHWRSTGQSAEARPLPAVKMCTMFVQNLCPLT